MIVSDVTTGKRAPFSSSRRLSRQMFWPGPWKKNSLGGFSASGRRKERARMQNITVVGPSSDALTIMDYRFWFCEYTSNDLCEPSSGTR